MLVHSLLVESIDLRRCSECAAGNDIFSNGFDGCTAASGEKNLGPFAREGACGSTADRTSASVDHCNLVFQHHLCCAPFLCASSRSPTLIQTPRQRENGRCRSVCDTGWKCDKTRP